MKFNLLIFLLFSLMFNISSIYADDDDIDDESTSDDLYDDDDEIISPMARDNLIDYQPYNPPTIKPIKKIISYPSTTTTTLPPPPPKYTDDDVSYQPEMKIKVQKKKSKLSKTIKKKKSQLKKKLEDKKNMKKVHPVYPVDDYQYYHEKKPILETKLDKLKKEFERKKAEYEKKKKEMKKKFEAAIEEGKIKAGEKMDFFIRKLEFSKMKHNKKHNEPAVYTPAPIILYTRPRPVKKSKIVKPLKHSKKHLHPKCKAIYKALIG